MIDAEIQIELDKLRNKIADIVRQRHDTVTHQEMTKAVDDLESKLRPELNALKRRAG